MKVQLKRCKRCNKLVASKDFCPTCEGIVPINDDPFVVTAMNITKAVASKKFSVREIEVMLSHAYHKGYISEDFYQMWCERMGVKPVWDKVIHICEAYYDTSHEAYEGAYFEQFEGGNE